jgi:hypothetical protein
MTLPTDTGLEPLLQKLDEMELEVKRSLDRNIRPQRKTTLVPGRIGGTTGTMTRTPNSLFDRVTRFLKKTSASG